jgi:hypothetical protein
VKRIILLIEQWDCCFLVGSHEASEGCCEASSMKLTVVAPHWAHLLPISSVAFSIYILHFDWFNKEI